MKYDKFVNVLKKRNVDLLLEHIPYECPNDMDKSSTDMDFVAWELKALYIDNNNKKGFIHHSNSFVGAYILFVKKKDGLLWFCVNYPIINLLSITN